MDAKKESNFELRNEAETLTQSVFEVFKTIDTVKQEKCKAMIEVKEN